MSERRRNALVLALLVVFAALAVAINALLGDGDEKSPSSEAARVDQHDVEPGASAPGAITPSPTQPKGRPSSRTHPEESESSREAAPPERRIMQRDRDVLADAAPVARQFLRAFARYEVGDLGAATRAELRLTTTAALFSELVSQPARLPPDGHPARAHPVGDFDVVPIAADTSGRELVEAELVTSLERAGARTPIGVRLRWAEGRWRVAGLTR